MRHTLAILFALWPGFASADFALTDMIGTWTGSGDYREALSKARMKCRLAVTGDAARVTMTGRCGSSLGAHTVDTVFVRRADGSVEVIAGPGGTQIHTEIQQVSGRITGDQLLVTGAAGHESVKMQFVKQADGTLYFATERKWLTGNSQSRVTLTRR